MFGFRLSAAQLLMQLRQWLACTVKKQLTTFVGKTEVYNIYRQTLCSIYTKKGASIETPI